MSKIILITGAASGIGLATSKHLARLGHKVYSTDITDLDVTDARAAEKMVAKIIRDEGRIDVLINNAGYGLLGSIEDTPLDEVRRQFDTNVFGMAKLTQLVLPHMRARKSGLIINIASIGGRFSEPLVAWYHASKFAVEGLSDGLRMELTGTGVKVAIIEPGIIGTNWLPTALTSLKKYSASYPALSKQRLKSLQNVYSDASRPEVIAKLIAKIITSNRPKSRYHAGKMSSSALFAARFLPDRLKDKIFG
jgi:short-subunit dehydrogenase